MSAGAAHFVRMKGVLTRKGPFNRLDSNLNVSCTAIVAGSGIMSPCKSPLSQPPLNEIYVRQGAYVIKDFHSIVASS